MDAKVKRSEILERAMSRISSPEKWCKRSFAQNAFCQGVDVKSPLAVSWCSIGATDLEAQLAGWGEDYLFVADPLYDAVKEMTGYAGVVAFQDFATHEQVMAMFRRAIEIAKEQEENINE